MNCILWLFAFALISEIEEYYKKRRAEIPFLLKHKKDERQLNCCALAFW